MFMLVMPEPCAIHVLMLLDLASVNRNKENMKKFINTKW